MEGSVHDLLARPRSGELEPDDFRAIMGSFATGIAVVTTVGPDGRPRGLTTNALCSVSLEPPQLLVSVDKKARTLPALLDAKVFVVNFLKEGRSELGRLFASKRAEKFGGVHWCWAGNGAPMLCDDSLAYAECTTVREIDAGDHVIIIGDVIGGRPPEPGERPLTYFGRAYGGITLDDVARSKPENAPTSRASRQAR